MEIDLAILGQVATESDIKGEVVLDLIERLVLAESELEAIKKQEPLSYIYPWDAEKLASTECFVNAFSVPVGCPEGESTVELFAKPLYQHSFTVDGHTFYADSEVDILYLERKFGVGGKAKLNLVEDK